MIKTAYLLGYSKTSLEVPDVDQLKLLKWGPTLSKLMRMAEGQSTNIARGLDMGSEAMETARDYGRLKRAGVLGNDDMDKKSTFQPIDMPPSGEPDYSEGPEEVDSAGETVDNIGSNITPENRTYSKRQAPANQIGTQYE